MQATKRTVKQSPLTDEQKQQRILAAIAQKREALVTGIIYNLVSGKGVQLAASDAPAIAETAFAIADKVIETLYPINEVDA